MTQRKPPGTSFENFADAQIRKVNRSNVSGPPTTQPVLDVEKVVALWKSNISIPAQDPDPRCVRE